MIFGGFCGGGWGINLVIIGFFLLEVCMLCVSFMSFFFFSLVFGYFFFENWFILEEFELFMFVRFFKFKCKFRF